MAPGAETDRLCIRVVAAEIERDGRYLITQRRPEATMPLLWEFPGGRVEDGESDQDALKRELMEEMAIRVKVGELSLHVVHEYADYTVEFMVYGAATEDDPQAIRVHDFRWVSPDDFDQYEFPAADQQTVEALLGLS